MSELTSHLKKIGRSPTTTAAFLFAGALTALEAYFFRQDYARYWQTFAWQNADDYHNLLFVAFAFAALFFFVRSSLASGFKWRCVYFGVFALAISVEYGFFGALGRFTRPTDLENAFYASDASDKFGAVTLFFSPLIFAPLAAYRWLFRFAPANAAGGAKLFIFNLLFLFAGFALAADFYRSDLPTNAFAAHFNNLTVSALYFGETKLAQKTRREIPPLERRAPANNVVFIVDESVRADHLSLNGYERSTTPTLDRLEKAHLLKNWGYAASGATESVGSNRLLLTGLNETPDRENLISQLPTVFQYARAAGYETFYFDGQDYSSWIGSRADQREFGRIFTSGDFPDAAPEDLDAAFARRVSEIVGSSTGNFIWINKRGVHFRYEKNYPPGADVWRTADAPSRANRESADALVNNYDNAVRYNSESFFGALAANGFPPDTVFVYTSDHGQTLRPNRATHAGASTDEALVPLFLIGRDPRLQLADRRCPAAHRNLFATLLDLMDFPPDLRVYDYAPSLFAARSGDCARRTFAVGNLSGAFGGKTMPFDGTEGAR